uniref:Step II splicing factor slu7, putative n=1 Tax=Arundo donax TaxID=35708 RepID=A0A0A8ZNF4_ARUDO
MGMLLLKNHSPGSFFLDKVKERLNMIGLVV